MTDWWEVHCSFEILNADDREKILQRVIDALLDVIDTNCNGVCERMWVIGSKVVDYPEEPE